MRGSLFALACLLLAACQAPPSWEELEFPAPLAMDQAWFLARESAAACKLGMDENLSQEQDGEYVSIWEMHLMPFNKGWRRRLHLRFLPGQEEQVMGFRFYVERQKNTAMERAYSPEASDWGADGQDRDLEGRFAQHVRVRLRSGDWLAPGGERPKREDPFGR